MFMAVDSDQDGLVSEEELRDLLGHANILLTPSEFRRFIANAKRFEAPGGGWRFQNFCNLVVGRRRPQRAEEDDDAPSHYRADQQSSAVGTLLTRRPKPQVDTESFLPDIHQHTRSPKTQHRLQSHGKQLLQGGDIKERPPPTSRAAISDAAVTRLRRKQTKVETQKVQAQLKLNKNISSRVGLDPAVLQRVCLRVYPIWKKLRSAFATLKGRRGPGGRTQAKLCSAKKFCRILERQAKVSAADATSVAHAFYEDRHTVDGVNYLRFLEAIVRNFIRG